MARPLTLFSDDMPPQELDDGTAPRTDEVLEVPSSVPDACIFIRSSHDGSSLRERLGLDSSVSSANLTEVAFGSLKVTTQERQLLESNYAARSNVDTGKLVEVASALFADAYIGVHWVAAEGLYVNVRDEVDLDTDALLSELRTAVGDSRGIVNLHLVHGGTPDTVRRQNNAFITEHARELYDLGYHSSATDKSCGHLVVYASTDADTTGLASLLEQRMHPTDYTIILTDDRPADDARTDHHDPYIGGLAVSLGSGCTSNVGWYKANGERWAVTAGHCTGTVSPDPRPLYYSTFTQNETWDHGNQVLNDVSGLTTYTIYGGRADIAITRLDNTYQIANETIDQIFANGADSHLELTWWQWDRSLYTVEEHPIVGDTIAHSGRNWSNPRLGVLADDEHTSTGIGDVNDLWSHFHDMMDANYSSNDGDSGGTVWTVDGNGDAILSGIHRAGGGIYTHISEVQSTWPSLEAPADMS